VVTANRGYRGNRARTAESHFTFEAVDVAEMRAEVAIREPPFQDLGAAL
jgi:hypothetical protein